MCSLTPVTENSSQDNNISTVQTWEMMYLPRAWENTSIHPDWSNHGFYLQCSKFKPIKMFDLDLGIQSLRFLHTHPPKT